MPVEADVSLSDSWCTCGMRRGVGAVRADRLGQGLVLRDGGRRRATGSAAGIAQSFVEALS